MSLELAERHGSDAGTHYRLTSQENGSVHVWEPTLLDKATAGLVIFVHGFRLGRATHKWYVDQVWEEFNLQYKWQKSQRNARFVAIQSRPTRGDKHRWGSFKSLIGALTEQFDALDGPVVVVGHSAAYNLIAGWLHRKASIDHITLLDGLYGHLGRFEAFMKKDGTTCDMVTAASGKPFNNARVTQKRVSHYLKLKELPQEWSDIELKTKNLYMSLRTAHMSFVVRDDIIPILLRRSPLAELEIQGC